MCIIYDELYLYIIGFAPLASAWPLWAAEELASSVPNCVVGRGRVWLWSDKTGKVAHLSVLQLGRIVQPQVSRNGPRQDDSFKKGQHPFRLFTVTQSQVLDQTPLKTNMS